MEENIKEIVEAQKLTGLSIARIDNSGTIYFNYGYANITTKTEVTENTVFEFASLTKPLVSLIAVKLCRAFRIPLKTEISRLVKEYSIYPEITIENILSHSTGFPNWPADSRRTKLQFTPGSAFSYSGFAFSLLEKIFIKLSGKSSEELLQTLICRPLGLKNTSLIYREKFEREMALGTKMGRPMSKWKPESPALAGSLHSTVKDYSLILRDLLSPEPLIFSESIKEKLFANYQSVSQGLYWGLGWGIEETEGCKYYWHWGDNEVFQSFFWSAPFERKALLMVTNCENGNRSWDKLTRLLLKRELKALDWLQKWYYM